uniref:Uncharacterized protein n=1 Tax=Varanus komodoensis TaxID=61221 RepID=A0A8D2L051_VARKO
MVGFKPMSIPPAAAVKFMGAGIPVDLITFPLDTTKARWPIQGEIKQAKVAEATKYKGLFSGTRP